MQLINIQLWDMETLQNWNMNNKELTMLWLLAINQIIKIIRLMIILQMLKLTILYL